MKFQELVKQRRDRERSQGGQKRSPWRNPLQGEYKQFASAKVSMQGMGLRVGFLIKF